MFEGGAFIASEADFPYITLDPNTPLLYFAVC